MGFSGLKLHNLSDTLAGVRTLLCLLWGHYYVCLKPYKYAHETSPLPPQLLMIPTFQKLLLYDKGEKKMGRQVSWIFSLIHQPGCRFIMVKVLMDFQVSPSCEGQNGGLLYRLSASRQTGEKRFWRDPHPGKEPSSSACQSIILPLRPDYLHSGKRRYRGLQLILN